MKNRVGEWLNVIGILRRKYGLIGLFQVLWSDVLYDYRNGVDTYAPVAKEDLFQGDRLDTQNRYVPSTFAVIDAGLAVAREHLGGNFSNCSFIDYGSGKGKVLIAAAQHAFDVCTGIEYSHDLHVIAENNVKSLKLQNKIKLLEGDASNFFPGQNDRVLYFFNPFMGEILEACIRNIKQVKPDGKRLLILFNPVEDARMSRHFKKIHDGFAMPGQIRFCVYEG
jgi:16S rRNA G966 N2-methylase RsmD